MQTYQDVQLTLVLGAFNLTRWIRNNDAVRQSFPERNRSDVGNEIFQSVTRISCTLGIKGFRDNEILDNCYCCIAFLS